MIGTKVAHYEIIAKLGEGGMGVVYRATDTKLSRDVAIKLLPADLTDDPGRLERFRREAKLLAKLNHPSIAGIYGVEDSGGQYALVMELAEGQTLAERLNTGAIPFEEALLIAKQIAEALEAAHERGIIHRDLKPANIKVSEDGQIKVLDFGLAKAMEGNPASNVQTEHSPTLTMAATQAGLILGTAAYMSPEQARGRAADKRADIWSFGVVLYEMLLGGQLFGGETVSDCLAGVLRAEIDFSKLPAGTPPPIRKLLRRCLERDRKQRLQAIGDVRIEIEEALADPTGSSVLMEAPVIAPAAAGRRVWPWVAAVLAVALIVSLAALWHTNRVVEQPLMQFNVDLGSEIALGTLFEASAILSPDGTRLVYVSQGPDGPRTLHTRSLAQPQPIALPGTENARNPFFSPDGQWVGFFAGRELKKISAQGGAAVTLCHASLGLGGSWGEDGNIIAALDTTGGLSLVSAAGGTPKPVTELKETGENAHRWPQILPGGKAVLFTAGNTSANWDEASIEVQSLETGERKTLQRGGRYGRYVPSGHLVYVREGTLFAAPMDLGRLELTGAPAPVLEDVAGRADYGGAHFDFSQTGMFLYVSGDTASSKTTIHWLDHTGKTEPLLATPGRYMMPRFSPDGRRLALITGDVGSLDISVYDWGRDTMSRLTFDPGTNSHPVWTPDGRYIAFGSNRDGEGSNIYLARADGAGEAERLTENNYQQNPSSFSPGGERLAFFEERAGTGSDIWTLPLESSGSEPPQAGQAEPFLGTPAREVEPVFSPDGRWLAYAAAESGGFEVYVRPFPGPGGKWQISNGGGSHPVWSPNGRELFYGNRNNQIMVTAYTADGDSFRAGTPRLWSETRFYSTNVFEKFDLAPNGKRFAILVAEDEAGKPKARTRVTVLLNFRDELRRRVPVE